MGNTEKDDSEQSQSAYPFIKKVLIVVGIVAATTILVLFVWYALHLLLLIFAGVLLGVLFRGLRDMVAKFTGLSYKLSLTVILFVVFTSMGGLGYLLGPEIYNQANRFYEEIPGEWQNIKQQIWQYRWGKEIARENPDVEDILKKEKGKSAEDQDMTKNVLSLFEITFDVVVGIILAFVIAIYIAAEPQVYTSGLLRLIHKSRRERALQVLDKISVTIQWWAVGQLVSMTILGIFTTAGLWLMDIPYALILGLFTALMTFIPNVGPIIAGIPTLLVAYSANPGMVIYVAVFYIVLQNIEGYFITPMVHRGIISVPPAIIITVQFLLYYLIGFIGILVAMPLVVCVMVIVQMVYVEDILGDSMKEKLFRKYRGKSIF